MRDPRHTPDFVAVGDRCVYGACLCITGVAPVSVSLYRGGMDNEAKKPLTWRSKNTWGTVGNSHFAEGDGWKYCVDQPSKGHWELRGWGPDGAFLYRHGFRTVKAAKAEAQGHANEPRNPEPNWHAVLRMPCPECDSMTSHKMDCSQGRNAR